MAELAAQSTPRRITIKKRDDFDGYGFNLHAEKGKPGQYIGKVDPDSPAEHSGLRQGDRILEVNGVDIGAETHKQVVERIKAVPDETVLLVLAPSPGQAIPTLHTNGSANGKVANGGGSGDNNNSKVVSSDATMMDDKMSSKSSNADDENSTISINNNESAKAVTGSLENNHNSAVSGLQLNLKMTAAEMRAMLQAKKKRDPKNETIDLKKKHDIIEKL